MIGGVGGHFVPATKKKPFGFSHCWMKLNGIPKWQTVLKDIENDPKKMKKNDGSSSQQSIGLDDEDVEGGGEEGQATVPKRDHQVMGNKWEKGKVAASRVMPLLAK